MPTEIGLWRAENDQLTKLTPSPIGLESELETYIESDPSLLGEALLIIGRQVPTAHGGYIDLLALDDLAMVHVLELKRDKTPRDVTAQTLDYGSWVATLGRSDIAEIYTRYRPDRALEEDFAETFGGTLPDEVNSSHILTIVAASVDSATERIVKYLNEDNGVPINVVFFNHFEDNGASYLARTWLVDDSAATAVASSPAARKAKSREPWNGRDWYVSFGDEPGGRSWDDASQFGFVSGGGDKWFSRTLKNLPIGGKVFTCIPKIGYVGVGTVTGEAQRFDQAKVEIDGSPRKLNELPLTGTYSHDGDSDDDLAEWVVPVTWDHTVPREKGIWRTGMFANQNTATKLRNQFTIEQVVGAFGLDED